MEATKRGNICNCLVIKLRPGRLILMIMFSKFFSQESWDYKHQWPVDCQGGETGAKEGETVQPVGADVGHLIEGLKYLILIRCWIKYVYKFDLIIWFNGWKWYCENGISSSLILKPNASKGENEILFRDELKLFQTGEKIGKFLRQCEWSILQYKVK